MPGWDAGQGGGVGGYVIPAGTASLAGIPITAAVPGLAGNVNAGTITQLGGIPGIDYSGNPAPTTGGLDAESDASMKARFPLFIASLRDATLTAIQAAIVRVQQSLTYFIAANQDEAGNFEPGHFVVTIDDGSGTPSADLKAQVYASIDAVRSLCETFSVQSPPRHPRRHLADAFRWRRLLGAGAHAVYPSRHCSLRERAGRGDDAIAQPHRPHHIRHLAVHPQCLQHPG